MQRQAVSLVCRGAAIGITGKNKNNLIIIEAFITFLPDNNSQWWRFCEGRVVAVGHGIRRAPSCSVVQKRACNV